MTLTDISNCITRLPRGMTGGAFICCLVVLILASLGVFFVLLQKKPVALNRVLGSIGIIFAALTLIFSILSVNAGILFIKTDGNPASSVDIFYSQIVAGNFTDSYKLLKDYSTLGLENVPDDKYAAQIYEALKKSYSYEIVGETTINEFNAVSHVRFTYLETSRLKENISKEIDTLIQEKVDTLSRKELYDDKGNYRPELLEEVYDEAFNRVLSQSDKFITTTEYDVELEYVGNSWLILVNDDMTLGFAGGV